MALQKQNVPILLGQGVDTKTDPKSVLPGKLLVLENAVLKTKNRIQKRNGYDALGTGVIGSATPVSEGQAIASYRGELVMFDGDSLLSYDQGNDAWVNKGSFASVHVSQRPVVRNTYVQTAQDSALHSSGLQCFAWEDSQGGVRYSIVDSATGLSIVPNGSISATGTRPKVLTLGNSFLVFYVQVDASFNNLYFAQINTAAPTSSPSSTLITNALAPSLVYDAEVIGQRYFVTYAGSTGNLKVVYYTSALSVSSALTVASSAFPSCATIFGDSNDSNAVVAWHDGTAVRFAVYDYNMTTTVQARTNVEHLANVASITGVATEGDSSLFTLCYTVSSPSAGNRRVRSSTVTAYAAGSASTIYRSVGLASKAFVYAGAVYLVLAHESTLQSTYFLGTVDGALVAKAFPGVGGGQPTRPLLAEVNTSSTTAVQTACLVKNLLTVEGGKTSTQTGVASLGFDFCNSTDSYLRAELGRNLHIGGGFLQMYDGSGPVEHGFHLFPEGVSVNSTASTVGQFKFDDDFQGGEWIWF